MKSSTKKVLKSILFTLLAIICLIVLVLGSYVLYLTCQYYRIEDKQELSTTANSANLLSLDTNYSITTYNIGFGAYSHDFTFFMDSGEKIDGTKTQGSGSRAESKNSVVSMTAGAISAVNNNTINPDFMFFQEVDLKADRSHFVNQYEQITKAVEGKGYGHNFTSNFHSGYLFYPITNPHGAVEAGMATYSKYKIDSTVRRSFPIDESFPNKFFDLDRCFSVNKLPINGTQKYLVLINLHMSAYDKGGVIRAKQLAMLLDYVESEYLQGNYVIAGGDWNHDIADSKNYFATDMKVPDWVGTLNKSDLPAGFDFKAGKNAPTCRSTDISYQKKPNGDLVNYSVVLDGYLVSDNVSVSLAETIDTDFLYSDHNPQLMNFKLLP